MCRKRSNYSYSYRDNIPSFGATSNDSQSQASVLPVPPPALAPARTITRPRPTATVPADKQTKVIDTKNLNEQDLKTLKEYDPFLYYSIPFVRDAEVVRNGEVQFPLHDQDDEDGDDIQSSINTKVERKSRISYECHPDLLLADLLDDLLDLNLNEPERA